MSSVCKTSFIVLLACTTALGQEENPTTWPYGGIPDTTRHEAWMTRMPLNFSEARFSRSKFDSTVYFFRAQFSNIAEFMGAQFSSTAEFFIAEFNSDAYFFETKFGSMADFYSAQFDSTAYFSQTKFDGTAGFYQAQFDGTTYFQGTQFNSTAGFSGAQFKSTVSFRQALFDSISHFSEAQFNGIADFYKAEFNSTVDFSGTQFNSTINLREARFNSTAEFSQARFSGTVNLVSATFAEGVDLRQTNFDSVNFIYLDESFIYPESKLQFYWDQFKAKDSLRIAFWNPPSENTDHYRKIEITYHKLRDNFLAQRNNASADAVMYELAWQRRAILKEWHWILYGWFFGWGYQAWRFALFIVLPIALLFAVLWHFKYYAVVALIVNADLPENIKDDLKETKGKTVSLSVKNRPFFKANMVDFTKLSAHISGLERIWHSIYFSFSVLLGIRWKKDWSNAGYSGLFGGGSFLKVVTFEYILGLSLLVAFALLVKSSRFAFIKDLLGF